MADTILPNFFVDEDGDSCEQFGETNIGGAGSVASSDDIFSILEALEGHFSPTSLTNSSLDDAFFASSKETQEPNCTNTIPTTTTTTTTTTITTTTAMLVSQKSTTNSSSTGALQGYETETETEAELELELEPEVPSSPKSKRQKMLSANYSDQEFAAASDANLDGQQKMSHINVERNRRKQMNEHLTVLRGLMPCFYVKRGDQASIIGGVVDYISELQQVLQSLEAKKQRKVYSDIVLSPRLVSSPRPSPVLSPRKPPLSPKPNLPISPRTPQSCSTSPYKPRLQQVQATNSAGNYNLSPTMATAPSLDPSPCNSSSTTSSINDSLNELVANSKSAIADVEVKFSGPNLLVKTLSPRIPGQAMKIISTLEELSLEILHADIKAIDDSTMVFSFTIKIGIECQLSADELAQQIQQTFC